MFTTNPFAALSQSIPPAAIQTYVAVMIVLVAAGTSCRQQVSDFTSTRALHPAELLRFLLS